MPFTVEAYKMLCLVMYFYSNITIKVYGINTSIYIKRIV